MVNIFFNIVTIKDIIVTILLLKTLLLRYWCSNDTVVLNTLFDGDAFVVTILL